MGTTALTEAVFYILLSLDTPLHGYGIMQNVESLSGPVNAGSCRNSHGKSGFHTFDGLYSHGVSLSLIHI